jgi:AraC-like DNA-binding protein
MATTISDVRAHGLRITRAVTRFDDVAWRRGEANDDMVRLHFGVRGDYAVRYPVLGRSFDLVGGHHNVLYSQPFALEFVNKTSELETFGVQFPREQFVAYTAGANDQLSRFCERISAGEPALLFDGWASLTPQIADLIRQMSECKYTGTLKDLFMLSKSIELLVASVDAPAAASGASTAFVKRAGDRERLVAARELVSARLAAPPTLSEVAKSVGLNEYKLKRGFKEMFGTTVFEYLSQQRLELARRLLLDTDKHVAEVAFELGYATPQHFSHAFKRRFGVSPNSIRKNP